MVRKPADMLYSGVGTAAVVGMTGGLFLFVGLVPAVAFMAIVAATDRRVG